jgi:hypothetical protein
MRSIMAAMVAASLFANGALAAHADTPLPPGKPAGLQQAQGEDHLVWYALGAAAIIAGVAVLATNADHNSSNPNPVSSTSGTSP